MSDIDDDITHGSDRTDGALDGRGSAASSGGAAHAATTADTASATDHHHEDDGHEHHDHAPVPASGPDDSIAHVFDQTNGVIEGAEGESGGTADGDDRSAGDRDGMNEPNPVGQQDAWHDDHYGAEDGRDRNP